MRRDLMGLERAIPQVYAYAAYRLGAGPDAEDVTSETFERALRYEDSFDPTRGNGTSWLIGIARRVIASGQPLLGPAELVAEEAVESHETRSIRSLELGRAVATLDQRDREIVALRFGADLTAKEIARILELRVNTVEVALHRALARLRDELGEADACAPTGFAAPAPNGS